MRPRQHDDRPATHRPPIRKIVSFARSLKIRFGPAIWPDQKTYRRMLTFMITPTANIIEASAEPP